MENNKISIIIPVYNSEKYLKRCLDSVLRQSYPNLEIVIVNDGSTDNSREICENYQKKDARIVLLHQENKGVSSARNYALETITGDYVMFVDSDDWIEENTCKQLLQYAIEKNASIITSSPINVSETGDRGEIVCDSILQQTNVENEFSFLDKRVLGVIWGTLYRKECIQDLRFEKDVFVGEDTIFYAEAVKRCKEIFFTTDCFYNYVNYTNSAAHGKIDEKKMTNLLAWKKISDIFKNNRRISDSAKGAYGRQCAYFIHRMWTMDGTQNPYYKVCKQGMKDNWKYMMRDSILKNKLYYCCMRFIPGLYYKIKNI